MKSKFILFILWKWTEQKAQTKIEVYHFMIFRMGVKVPCHEKTKWKKKKEGKQEYDFQEENNG